MPDSYQARTLQQLVSDSASTYAERPAVTDWDVRLTYA